MTTTPCGHRQFGKVCQLTSGHAEDHANDEGRTWHNYGPLDWYEITWMSGHIGGTRHSAAPPRTHEEKGHHR